MRRRKGAGRRLVLLLTFLVTGAPALLSQLSSQQGQGPAPAAGEPPALGSIAGRVIRQGTDIGIADVQITLTPPARPGSNGASSLSTDQLRELDRAGAITPEIVAMLQNTRGAAATSANPPLITWTDGDGRFFFADVPVGNATVRAQLQGYFGPLTNGAYPTVATALVPIGRDGPASMTLSMTPGGTISGRVTDPSGKVLSDVPVSVSRLAYQEGTPVLQAVTQKTTDDRGEYRLYRLPPGEYYVSATPPGLPPARPGVPREIPVATLYPNVVDLAETVTLVVQGGDEIAGTDIQIRTARPVKISGKVVSPLPPGPVTSQVGGQVRQPTLAVALAPAERSGVPNGPVGTAVSVNAADNTFTIQDVLPGRYDIYARVPIAYGWGTANPPEKATGPWAIGRTTIDVGSENVEDVNIAIRPGMDIRGRLIVDGHPDAYNARIALRPDESYSRINDGAFSSIYGQVASFPVSLGADGLFFIPLVPEGRYRMQVSFIAEPPAAAANRGQAAPASSTANPQQAAAQPPQPPPPPPLPSIPSGAFIADIRQGTFSVYDNGLVVGREPVSLDIFVSTHGGGVEGTVHGVEQKPISGMIVVLAPPANRRQNSLLYKASRSDAQGRFSFSNLEPGEYKVFAWDSIPSEAYLNAVFLAQYEERGAAVTVVAAGRTSVEANVILRLRKP